MGQKRIKMIAEMPGPRAEKKEQLLKAFDEVKKKHAYLPWPQTKIHGATDKDLEGWLAVGRRSLCRRRYAWSGCRKAGGKVEEV